MLPAIKKKDRRVTTLCYDAVISFLAFMKID